MSMQETWMCSGCDRLYDSQVDALYCCDKDKRIAELEAQLDATEKNEEILAEHNKTMMRQLDAVRLEHRKEYDRAEMETGRAKDAEAQLDAVREMEVPTGYSAKFTHGWGSCLQTVKAIVGESDE